MTRSLRGSRPLKVLRVMPVLDFGGVESRVVLQSRLHARDEYDLSVCAFHRDGVAGKAVRAAGVPVYLLGTDPSPRNPLATAKLAWFLARHRPDLVHASIAEANLHSMVAARLARIPIVVAEETGMPAHSRLAKAVYGALYPTADAVIGVTQAVCDYVENVDRAPARLVRLIYNCAGPEYFPETRRAPKVGGSGGPVTVLLVGRLVPVKNHALFLRAFEQAANEVPALRLWLVGDGPLRPEMERLAAAPGLRGRVELMGFRSDVRDLLAQADLFALPSLSEGCSISLVEAMASAVPVVGSAVPGIMEVLGPLAKEWTAPPTDVSAWATLLARFARTQADVRAELARRAQQLAYERFAPVVYLRNVESLYRELSSRKGRPS